MKLIPFVMPGFPSIRASRDVSLFLQTQPDVIIETALPSLQPSGSALVQKVRQTVMRAGIKAEDILSTFRQSRKKQSAMLMLHAEPDGQQLSQIHASFDYAIAPFAPQNVAALNTGADVKRKNQESATQFGAQVGLGEPDIEASVLASQGFIYLKVAPEREGTQYPEDEIRDAIRKIKAIKDIKVFCGFGVKTVHDIRMLKNAGADGVFLGAQSLKKQQEELEIFKHAFEEWQQAADAKTD